MFANQVFGAGGGDMCVTVQLMVGLGWIGLERSVMVPERRAVGEVCESHDGDDRDEGREVRLGEGYGSSDPTHHSLRRIHQYHCPRGLTKEE